MHNRFLTLSISLLLPFFLFAQSSYRDTAFTEAFRQFGPGWNAGDGSISMLLPDGSSLWMFGDSYIGSVDAMNEMACLFEVRSAVAIQDKDDISLFTTLESDDQTDQYTKQIVQKSGDNMVTYWPAAGFMHNDTIHTFWSRFEHDTNYTWNLRFDGMVIAKLTYPDFELASVDLMQQTDLDREWGNAYIRDEEAGYYYLYGKGTYDFVVRPFVARCPLDGLLGTWEFYTGSGWTTDLNLSLIHI